MSNDQWKRDWWRLSALRFAAIHVFHFSIPSSSVVVHRTIHSRLTQALPSISLRDSQQVAIDEKSHLTHFLTGRWREHQPQSICETCGRVSLAVGISHVVPMAADHHDGVQPATARARDFLPHLSFYLFTYCLASYRRCRQWGSDFARKAPYTTPYCWLQTRHAFQMRK